MKNINVGFLNIPYDFDKVKAVLEHIDLKQKCHWVDTEDDRKYNFYHFESVKDYGKKSERIDILFYAGSKDVNEEFSTRSYYVIRDKTYVINMYPILQNRKNSEQKFDMFIELASEVIANSKMLDNQRINSILQKEGIGYALLHYGLEPYNAIE